MDYVVGSVAALISGNVTPNRPKTLKRALTPMKHQPSPNVTPKSESVADRSIFLSPTMQKKKAMVKKSPKRIFQNQELDVTRENDGSISISSPKAEKVKKHLKDELDVDKDSNRSILSPKSPKNKSLTSSSKEQLNVTAENLVLEENQFANESSPKKKKNKLCIESELTTDRGNNTNVELKSPVDKGIPKKKKKSNTFSVETISNNEAQSIEPVEMPSLATENIDSKIIKHKKKSKKTIRDNGSNLETDSVNKENENQGKMKKYKKHKKKASNNVDTDLEKEIKADENTEVKEIEYENADYINPNAITSQDTDSEHESDDEINSENEESNKAVLDTGPQESSDEEDDTDKKPKKDKTENVVKEPIDAEEVKRTLFVGNVPFSSKCKKEIKKIFSKYGEIETVRIRTVPVKDGRVTPKLAVIKNELHPDRSTVNVYVKYAHPSSVYDALVENNRVLNEHHLRVSRSDVTGSEHDPRCSVFVGNIPFALEDEGLRAKFERCGEIESVRIVRDRKTNAGKGFGYVNFKSKDGVELALALTEEDLTLKNRILRVKRCTQATANQHGRQKSQGRQQNNLGRQRHNLGRQDNYQSRPQGNQERQNYSGRPQNNQGRLQNYKGRPQGNQGRLQTYQGRPQGHEGRPNYQGRQQFDRPGRNQFQRQDQNPDGNIDGAYRRIMNKRKPQDSNDGPPQKKQHSNDPSKEKKQRKEFVGITADKKKFQKRKLSKDQKKKRELSEILTKQRQ